MQVFVVVKIISIPVKIISIPAYTIIVIRTETTIQRPIWLS